MTPRSLLGQMCTVVGRCCRMWGGEAGAAGVATGAMVVTLLLGGCAGPGEAAGKRASATGGKDGAVIRAASGEVETGPAGQAYAGLVVRDDAPGCLVSWIMPGPLAGEGLTSKYLQRGDLLLSINGQAASADALKAIIKASRPGEVLHLEVMRTGADPGSAVPTPGLKKDLQRIEVVLGSRQNWLGPGELGPPAWYHGPSADDLPEPAKSSAATQPQAAAKAAVESSASPPLFPAATPAAATELEKLIAEQAQAHQFGVAAEDLLELFRATQRRRLGRNSLQRVARCFDQPLRTPQLQREVTDALPAVAGDPRQVLIQAAVNLDVAPPALRESVNLSDPAAALAAAAAAVVSADGQLQAAFARLSPQERQQMPQRLRHLATALAESDVSNFDNPRRSIQAMQISLQVDFAALLQAAGELSGFLVAQGAPPAKAKTVPLPAALAGAVEGSVLAVLRVGERWLVYGGGDKNRYDLSRVDVVIDAAGDDQYHYSAAEKRPAIQLVVDLAGNDEYHSTGEGPAAAIAGVSLLVDVAGNDDYRGERLSCAAAMEGVAILLDRAGDDHYQGSLFSQGVGYYGVGAILDLGGGSDVYEAQVYSQGMGGARGMGLILEQGGSDFYRANGTVASAYGTPATFFAMSQGVGFGIRGFDSGGIGVICDFSGNDRYEAGEFSQGGGYSFGLGILNDRGGNDLYFGDRYGQGYGCHQAIGVLDDDGGDDTYWARTAADQGGSWDIAVGLLLDRGGNDTYHAPGLSLGGAAEQAIALCIDLGGLDHRVCPLSATLGQSGDNSYHYVSSGCMSLSVFVDAGGEEDFYPAGRKNNQILSTGSLNEKDPQHSSLFGLFIDRQEKLNIER